MYPLVPGSGSSCGQGSGQGGSPRRSRTRRSGWRGWRRRWRRSAILNQMQRLNERNDIKLTDLNELYASKYLIVLSLGCINPVKRASHYINFASLHIKLSANLWCSWRMWRVCWRRSSRTCSWPGRGTRTLTQAAARRWGRSAGGWSRAPSRPRGWSRWSSHPRPAETRRPAAVKS